MTLWPKEGRDILDKFSFLQDAGDRNMQMSIKIESLRPDSGSSKVNGYGRKIQWWKVTLSG